MDVERVPLTKNTNALAAEQVRALLDRLPTEGAVPLFVFDAGYDPVQVQQGLEGCEGQILVRLRAGRCFYADPVGPPAPTGRHRRHGRKFECKDPASWPEPSAEHVCEDAGYGTVRVRAWAGLHPKVQAHAGRGSRGPTPIVRGTLVVVEVQRLPGGERRREPRVLWLWWHALDGVAAAPDLGLLLAGLRAALRPGAHVSLPQAEYGMDHPSGATSRAGRPLDVVGGCRLHAA